MFDDVEESHLDPNDEAEKNKLHFYYNREERLKKAPQIVKDYYEGKNKPVKGIKIFFTGQNRYIFFALIFFVAVAWIYSGFNGSRNYTKLEGLDCELNAFSYEDQVFTSLQIKRNVKSKDTSPKTVNAEFFLIDGDNQVVAKETQSIVYSEGEQYMRLKNSDFEIVRVDVIIDIGDAEKEVSTRVKR